MVGGSVRVLMLCCVVGVRLFVFVCARGASFPLLLPSFQLAGLRVCSHALLPVPDVRAVFAVRCKAVRDIHQLVRDTRMPRCRVPVVVLSLVGSCAFSG